MHVLGVSCDYHDAAAALVVDGKIVAAAEEERFSRIKHDNALPTGAIASCLAMAGLTAADVDAVVFHEKPLVVASRVVSTRQRQGFSGIAGFVRDVPVLLRRNLFLGYRVEKALAALGAGKKRIPIYYGEHHRSHAAAAFFPSPFEEAAIVTVDGVGEWATSTIGHGVRGRVDLLTEQRFPHSLGLLYSLVTAWCGFEPNDGEYKLMGLAPFGEPTYADALRQLIEVDDDGSYRIDVDKVRWWAGDPAEMKALVELFDGPPRTGDERVSRRDVDLARSVQELVEDAVMRIAMRAQELTGSRHLCLGGGVALNCVANGKLLRDGPFDSIWVQPSPGDAGSAIGAALWYWHHELGNPRHLDDSSPVADGMGGGGLGPDFSSDEVDAWLASEGVEAQRVDDRDALSDLVAARLEQGAIVGWFEGRMEFGPRALGHRSILADPRGPTVQRDINLRVKGRESFRPFAPAVLWEHASDWFEMDQPSPYMLFTFQVVEDRLVPVAEEPEDLVERVNVPRSQIPACTHVDGSARVQTVHEETAPNFYRLLQAFHRRTGCPILLNTSFNRAGEPIVCTPDDALRSARTAGLDVLVIDHHVIDLSGDRAEPVGVGADATS
ncbi:MAG: carbamoyltransferase [Acidimicrobiales bacterium]